MSKKILKKVKKMENNLFVFANTSNWGGKSDKKGFFKVLDEMDKKGISAQITKINKDLERNEEFCGC